MKNKLLMLPLMASLLPVVSYADSYCVKKIDKLQLFYVNGMFTEPRDFQDNIKALDKFQNKHLSQYDKLPTVSGAYNFSEETFVQVAEVAFHKMTEEEKLSDKGKLVETILRGQLTHQIKNIATTLAWFYGRIYADVGTIVNETDYHNMKIKLQSQLDKCTRTLLLTHSQGNFYGNRLFTDVSTSYTSPSGADLYDYPMLGYIGIANPTNGVGGSYGGTKPEIAKTFTNANDFIMLGVRETLGSVPANSTLSTNGRDWSGHALGDAYLEDNAAPILASMMSDIVNNLTPYPMFEQHPSSSSATSHIGYSTISEHLDIRFRYGGGYRYTGVPKSIWDDFYISTSHGTYFNKHIKDKFPYVKIEN